MRQSQVGTFALLVVVVLLLSACGSESDSTSPEPIVLSPTETPVSSPEPEIPSDREAIPLGLIQVAVPESAEQTLAALQSAEHRPRDYYRLAVQLGGLDPAALSVASDDWQTLALNDREEFVINADLEGDYQTVSATLRAIGESTVWWSADNTSIPDEAIATALARMEAEILPLNRLAFGDENAPGVNGDPRIHILMVHEEVWGGYFGYFSALNQYPAAIHSRSNERKMLVLNAAAVDVGSFQFGPSLGHELFHLIHWYFDSNEDLWFNESLAELASFYAGDAATFSETGPTNAGVFADNPQLQLTSRSAPSSAEQEWQEFGHYGAEKAFSIYLLDQFGPQFIQDLFRNPLPGVLGIQAELNRLAEPIAFNDLYANWLVANLLDQPLLADGQWGYDEYDTVRPVRYVYENFPVNPIRATLLPYAAKYFELRATGDVHVSFRGSSLARLTPADPASGQFAWYSNRGDESEFHLTRTFDLSNTTSATLTYKLWYDLERTYDYAFVEVSTNGGESWSLLRTQRSTSADPNELSYGWGYTGASGRWVEESVNLTEFAGQEVLLRFEVVTDFTISHSGLMLDDIAIPEIGYFDGAEDDAGGWEAVGFVRSANVVPTDWVIWVIKLTDPVTTVERITLDELQHAEFTISGFGSDFPFAAIILSPTAHTTTLDIAYELILGTE